LSDLVLAAAQLLLLLLLIVVVILLVVRIVCYHDCRLRQAQRHSL